MASLRLGIDTLLTKHQDWIRGQRIGLVSHAAAVDSCGATTAARLASDSRVELRALYGPEHGFFGAAAAGERVARRRHPVWGIPVYSLYGTQRKPTASSLRDIDILLIDFQSLPVRCYTYLATLLGAMEAAVEADVPVIILDRPVPLPCTVDGPPLESEFTSFVGPAPLPLVYGMTLAEVACWLRHKLSVPVDLRVAPMRGYRRESTPSPDWPPWISPSPQIRTWDTAVCYPCTVLMEGVPSLDYGRGTTLPFQVFGAPWLDAQSVRGILEQNRAIRGVRFHVHDYIAVEGKYAGRLVSGVRLTVTNARTLRPATVAVHILAALHAVHGKLVWRGGADRQLFFNRLAGGDALADALRRGTGAGKITRAWRTSLNRFRAERREALLYERGAQ